MFKKLFYLSLTVIVIVFALIGIRNYKKTDTVAIIGAMDVEVQQLINNISNPKTKAYGNYQITEGTIGKHKIIIAKSGVGKVNSAITTQFIIDKYQPNYIINTGIAGSIDETLNTGDILIAQKTVQHDFDLTAFGNPKGYIDNNEDTELDKPTTFYSDENLVNEFKNKLNSDKNKVTVKLGTIATGDIFVTKEQQKESIKKEFNANAVDMESASIAQTAHRNNIPIIILRTISDNKKGSEKEYKQNKPNTAEQSALKVISILKN